LDPPADISHAAPSPSADIAGVAAPREFFEDGAQLDNDDLASQMKAVAQAESVVWIFAPTGGAFVLAVAGLSAWALRTRSTQNAI
jgi:hypothetical protein